ncbi:nucleotidyltransferase domain-containing protein [Candidatus Woesearchaeota archaeon]|nr:nucleotidyltransferase domain-containing protein [Candidatus Woesearchaeota archaeon]
MNLIDRIKPFKEEEKIVENLTKEVFSKLNKIRNVKFVLGGSVSKDTWLKGTNEIDIFAKFNYFKFKEKDISAVLCKELKKLFKLKLVHGSRDYFHINFKGFTFEIVPILDIKNPKEAKNVTDLSPLHINFVKKYPKLKDEIRLLKMFCKTNSLYGAESYISGFSGYTLEILVIYYKNFKNVLKNATKWKDKTIIDILGKVKDPLNELNPSKIVSPLIIIDPADQTRNISASLSHENFYKFINLSKEYLKNPSEKFFVERNEIPKDAFVLKIIPLKGKKDVIGAKAVKDMTYIKNKLNEHVFFVNKSEWFWNKEIVFWFKVKNKKLSMYKIHKGPPESLEKNVDEFKKKHKNIFLKKGVYYAKIKREYVKVEDLIKKLLKDKYVKERVKEIKWK